MPTEYQIKIEKFEGPLDLLLQLIESQKLEITEVSLASVTDQYLEYLKNIGRINPHTFPENIEPGEEYLKLSSISAIKPGSILKGVGVNHLEIASFLVVASRLILLKSRALLPFFKLTEEEEEDIQDLQQRLEEYKKFKEFGKQIQAALKKRNFEFSREPYLGRQVVFYPPTNVSGFVLGEFFKAVLERLPKKEILAEEKITKTISLEEMISEIISKIEDRVERAFSEIIASRQSKVEVVVGFLALLELTKRQLIRTKQETIFGEIRFAKAEIFDESR